MGEYVLLLLLTTVLPLAAIAGVLATAVWLVRSKRKGSGASRSPSGS